MQVDNMSDADVLITLKTQKECARWAVVQLQDAEVIAIRSTFKSAVDFCEQSRLNWTEGFLL